MRLNPDCIRDVLLAVEDVTDFRTLMRFPGEDGAKHLAKYSTDEVLYHIKQCELSGLLSGVSWMMGGSCLIRDLSPKGHEFLANIRSETNWKKTKEVASKVGS